MKSIWDDITEEEVQWKYLDRKSSFGDVCIWEDGDVELDELDDYVLTDFTTLQRICDLSLEFCMRKGNDLV